MEPKNRNFIITLSAVTAFSLAVISVMYLLYGPFLSTGTPLVFTDKPLSQVTLSATSPWQVLQHVTPVVYTIPLADPVQSPIDGTYAKIDQSPPQWWQCRRCADYRSSGGIWKLQFDKGIMRIYYDVTGWHSLGSYTVSDDLLYIYNDPYCPQEMGEYRWMREDGNLELEPISDTCAFQLRGENLGKQTWSYCPPADQPVATGRDQPISAACGESPALSDAVVLDDTGVNVEVYGGDSRFFAKPPDVFALANNAKISSPEGIRVAYSQESISFGLNRVLWWQGEWIEAYTELPFTAMGVQFLGEPQMGWARLLFDGKVVWQGDTSEIWSDKGRHGGFIEISGYTPGGHTIRVESMGFDYHPVTVASFGFSYQDGDENLGS